MGNIKEFYTGNKFTSYKTHFEICRLHLMNLQLHLDETHPGMNIAKKDIIGAEIRDVDSKIELLLHNLLQTYQETTVILALRSLKMYKYCVKYLKSA